MEVVVILLYHACLLKPRLHDTTGCSSLTTMLHEQPLFVQPVWQPVVSCKRCFTVRVMQTSSSALTLLRIPSFGCSSRLSSVFRTWFLILILLQMYVHAANCFWQRCFSVSFAPIIMQFYVLLIVESCFRCGITLYRWFTVMTFIFDVLKLKCQHKGHTKRDCYFARRSGCEVLCWIRLSVCLSFCKDISRTTHAIFTQFFMHVACVRGLVLLRYDDDGLHCLSAGRGFLPHWHCTITHLLQKRSFNRQ